MCVNKFVTIQVCVCPNQGYEQIVVCLPTELRSKWAAHIGDDNSPQKQYRYSVTAAVQQAKSTWGHLSKCWKTYKLRAKNIGKQYFLDDVFRRFCDADFAKKRGDNSEGKFLFVLRILEEYDDAERSRPSEASHEFIWW